MDEHNRESNPNQYSASNFQDEHEMGETAADMNIHMDEMGPDCLEEMEAINEEEEEQVVCAGGGPEPFRQAANQMRKPNSGGQKQSTKQGPSQSKEAPTSDLNNNLQNGGKASQKSRAISGQDKRNLELQKIADKGLTAKQRTTGRQTNSTNSFVIEGQEIDANNGAQSIFQQDRNNQQRRINTAPFQPKSKRGQKQEDGQAGFYQTNKLFKSSFDNAGPPNFKINNPFGDIVQQGVSNQFVEMNLLKATNIYQQFDKKGNLFENRLYAKTSINQVKLAQDANVYDKKMETGAEEIYRINNQSMTMNSGSASNKYNQIVAVGGDDKAALETSLSGAARTLRSQGGARSNDANRTGSLSMSQRNTTKGNTTKSQTRNKTYFETQKSKNGAVDMNRCTFSRANGPRVSITSMEANPHKPYLRDIEKKSLFSKLAQENELINKDTSVGSPQKQSNNHAYASYQKSLQRLQFLNKSSNYWSNRDQEQSAVTLGIGGAMNAFRTAQNFHVNDPRFYKDRSLCSTRVRSEVDAFLRPKVSQTVRSSLGDVKNLYVYLDQALDAKAADLNKSDDVFSAGKTMQQDGREFYSRCLNAKGGSQVKIDHTIEGASKKFQKKAYGPHTQSRQVDGLFKPDKFLARTNMLNHSRVDYNIMRPFENKAVSMPHTEMSSKVVKNIRDGSCHQVYGICEFHQNSSSAGMKLHEGYQASMKDNAFVFRRNNGELARYADNIKRSKFY